MPYCPESEVPRPNIVVILADDMGFSDIGGYGSEIRTPHLDALAARGVRFSQFYNGARCCPTRAALLTGLHPHEAGVGQMVGDLGCREYQGYLRDDGVTLAETLRGAGYRTLMAGKWHVGGEYPVHKPEMWAALAGRPGHPTPRQRGFDRFYGTLGGGGSYFNPPTLMRDDAFVRPGGDYYLTDALAVEAAAMVREAAAGDAPFFLYAAFTAPHWPLHAREADIAVYEGRYREGWDAIRAARHERLKASGLLSHRWPISPRDPDAPPWEDDPHKEWDALRMAVCAAQVESMDRGIGRILDAVRAAGAEDNTLVFFLSDNGGCAEFLREDGKPGTWPEFYGVPTRDGRPTRVGNRVGRRPGPDDTFMSYDLPWANASNSPFRLFKSWVHEGGISTPLIASWPAMRRAPAIAHAPGHVIDLVPTCLDAAGVRAPAEFGGRAVQPPEGESLLPVLRGRDWRRERPIFIEHQGNGAVRDGEWKLVRRHGRDWELYNIADDRTERRDRADDERGRVRAMSAAYDAWAARCGVRPWPVRG
jgi:arylsulfatase